MIRKEKTRVQKKKKKYDKHTAQVEKERLSEQKSGENRAGVTK